MLSNKQIEYLVDLCKIRVRRIDSKVVGLFEPNKDIMKINYTEFKDSMEIDDIDMHWLTSYNGYIAGGAVLNWVWQENTNRDIDFFFVSEDAYDRFRAMIESFGFVRIDPNNALDYSKTDPRLPYKNSNKKIQVIGGQWEIGWRGYEKLHGVPYATPIENIKRFDLRICQFAVDCENVYFSKRAVADLLTRRIVPLQKGGPRFRSRLDKYIDKGLYYEEYKNVGKSAYLNPVKIGRARGRINGLLCDSPNSRIVQFTKIPFLSKHPKKKYGYPVRHGELQWGSFNGTSEEFIVPIGDIRGKIS